MKDFSYLELQWGETERRSRVLAPPELYANGAIRVPDRPGFGVVLNVGVAREQMSASLVNT